MEGRRVVLLTKGYLDGLLTFKYVTPFSKAREEYILGLVEAREVQKVSELRAVVDASIASGIPKSETIKLAVESFDVYRNMALPYMAKELTMEEGEAKAEHFKRIKEIHEKNKMAFEKMKELRKSAPEPATVEVKPNTKTQ